METQVGVAIDAGLDAGIPAVRLASNALSHDHAKDLGTDRAPEATCSQSSP